MAREHVQDLDRGQAIETTRIGRAAIEAAGYVFLLWAFAIGANIYTFGDPVARSVVAATLSHIPQILTHVPVHFALFIALIFTLASMIAPGDALLGLFGIRGRDTLERIGFGAAAGTFVLIALAYLLASVQLLRPLPEWIVLIGCAAWTIFWLRRELSAPTLIADTLRVPRALTVVLWIILGVTLYVALLAAVTPEVGFDARYYHLSQAERYAQHGGFYNLISAERVWAFALPHYQETVYAFGFVLFGQIGAKLIAWGGALATVLAFIAFARIWFGSTAIGLIASVVLFASPVVTWSATTANNDLAAVPFVILALHALISWEKTSARGALFAAGIFSGFTYGIKTFGAFTVVAFIVVIVYLLIARHESRSSILRTIGLFIGGAFLAALPALASAAWMIGDPIFPLAPGIFPSEFGAATMGQNVSRVVGARLAENMIPSHVAGLPWSLTVDTLVNRDLAGPIWLFTLPLWLGVAIFARRFTEVIRPLAGVALVYSLLVLISGAVEFRYFEPILPAIALLIGYALVGVDWSIAPTLRTVVIACVVAFAALDCGLATPLQKNSLVPSVMGLEYLNWDYLYGSLPESAIQLQYVPVLVYANEHLDAHHDKIYDGINAEIMNVYSQIELYNGVGYGSPGHLGEWNLESPDAYAQLKAVGCTYVLVTKTDISQLRRAPVWSHLRFVVETPALNGAPGADDLFKVTG